MSGSAAGRHRGRRSRRLAAAVLALAWLAGGATARAQSPPLCRGGVTDDTTRPIPPALVPAAVRLFGLEAMPREQVGRSTLYRCAEGRVLLCNLGANLPCDKANTSRDLPAATAWCAENPGSDFIPMYVTGHNTIYRWRCEGRRAITIGAPLDTDRQGFIAQFWKPADDAFDRPR
jgi:hypothetical protein